MYNKKQFEWLDGSVGRMSFDLYDKNLFKYSKGRYRYKKQSNK